VGKLAELIDVHQIMVEILFKYSNSASGLFGAFWGLLGRFPVFFFFFCSTYTYSCS
jgi:hypothetical protein